MCWGWLDRYGASEIDGRKPPNHQINKNRTTAAVEGEGEELELR